METDSGIRESDSVEYYDEVLNAGWLTCPDLHLQEVADRGRSVHGTRNAVAPDEFLRGVYRLQE